MYHANVLHPAKITKDDTTHKVEKDIFRGFSI